MGVQLKLVKTGDVAYKLQWMMGEYVVILTPVIISMCQLMADDSSYSSVVQRPDSKEEKYTTLHKLTFTSTLMLLKNL